MSIVFLDYEWYKITVVRRYGDMDGFGVNGDLIY